MRNLWFVAGLAAGLSVGWVAFPYAIYQRRPQPVNFSHKVHADKAGQKCEDCHTLRGDGSFAGIPGLDKCAGCHAAPMGTTAAEKQFIDQYVTPNREPAWLDYARQPENVWFSHATHLKLAGRKCETCHGDMGSQDGLRVYQQDRISGYSRDIFERPARAVSFRRTGGMKMDDCVDCHRRNGQENSCLDCHK